VVTLRVNGKTYQVDAEPGTPLLWVLRDSLGPAMGRAGE
jgi:isoquinoline 1-oxidoreductase alpha subunit